MRDCKQEKEEPIEIVVRRPTAPELRDAVSRVTNAALERIAKMTDTVNQLETARAYDHAEMARMRETLDRCAARDVARSLALGELLASLEGRALPKARHCQCGLCG